MAKKNIFERMTDAYNSAVTVAVALGGVALIALALAFIVTDIPLLTDSTRSVNFEDIRSDAEIPDIGLLDNCLTADVWVQGKCAETTHYWKGVVPLGTDHHYVVKLTDGSYAGLTVFSWKANEFDELADEAAERTPAMSFVPWTRVKGMFKSDVGEVGKKYNTWLRENGINLENSHIRIGIIDTTDTPGIRLAWAALFLVMGILCLLAPWFESFALRHRRNKAAKALKAEEQKPFSDA